jgi:hypothetical protein
MARSVVTSGLWKKLWGGNLERAEVMIAWFSPLLADDARSGHPAVGDSGKRLIPSVIRFLFARSAKMFFHGIRPGFQQMRARKRMLECAHSVTTCWNYLALK